MDKQCQYLILVIVLILISNYNLKSTIKLNQLIYKNDLLDLNNYLPKFKDSIELKNHQILINYEKNNIDISGKGKVIIEGKIDSLNYKINKKDDLYVFDTTVIVKENPLLFDAIEYEKNVSNMLIITLAESH